MKASYKLTVAGISMCVLVFFACKKDEYKNLDCGKINASFSHDIQPIIQASCLGSGCHNAGSGHGDFTGYKGVKGKANNGSFEKRVLIKKDMPSGSSLSLSDREKIKCWLSNGAPDN